MAGCSSPRVVYSLEQAALYSKLVEYYEQLKSRPAPIGFYNDSRVQQILLIRHGEPILDKKSARTRKKMKQYVYDYDTAKVYDFEDMPVSIKQDEIDTIYSSPIVRARDTASKLFGNQFTIVEDSIFREFEREVFPLPLIPLRPKTWGIISRIPWILGLQSRKIEGFGQAKRRAKLDALFLEKKAYENGKTVLVAHGFLNRYLEKYLQEQGWQLSYDGGKDYLSVKVLSRVTI